MNDLTIADDDPDLPPDQQLMAYCMQVVQSDGKFLFQVVQVDWHGPHEPHGRWCTLRRWTKAPTAERLLAAKLKALHMRRFFVICTMCEERNCVGHMADDSVCSGCAEKYQGVVF